MPATDWTAYNLPAIWTMIRAENTCTGADRVTNWESLAGDVRTQLNALQEARARLAAAWPPEENDSARAFLDKMDLVADSMSQTLRRAEDIRSGLRGIIEAIGEAQTAIRPWADARLVASDDLIPRWADHAEDEYDAKAREAMRRAEAAVADFTPQLDAPPLFEGAGDIGGLGIEVPEGGSGAGPSTPGAEALAPLPGSGSSARELEPGSPAGSGVDLAGAAPPVINPATASPPAGSGVPAAPGASLVPGAVIGAAGAIGAGGAIGGLPGRSGAPGRFGQGGIGGSGPVPPGSRSPSTPAPSGPLRAATPAGGVIGGVPPVMPGMGARPSGRGGTEDARGVTRGDADQSWEVPSGVAPVIRPDRRRHRHDPGPGIIGGSSS